MKKLALFVCLAFFGLTTFAQDEIKGGINFGLPVGDAGDITTFNLSIDFSYLIEIADQVQIGPTIGYSHSFGESIDVPIIGSINIDDVQFMPIAATGHYNFTDQFWFGLDLGYALGLNSGNNGGFYYSPRFAYGVTERIDIMAAFRGISLDGGSFDVISLGAEFRFN